MKMIVLKLDGACVVKGERRREEVYEMDGWIGSSRGWREKRAIKMTSRWMMELGQIRSKGAKNEWLRMMRKINE